jgi:hypothetical protein
VKDRINTTLSMKNRWHLLERTEGGDPFVATLKAARTLFSEDEIVVLINRALYAMNYQRETHQRTYQQKKATSEAS